MRDTTSELKSLETKLAKLRGEHKRLQREAADNQRRASELARQVLEVTNEIDALKQQNGELIVSEHALLRYCERVLGVSMDDARAAILPESIKDNLRTLGGSCTYPVPGTEFKIKIRGGVVVTILTDDKE